MVHAVVPVLRAIHFDEEIDRRDVRIDNYSPVAVLENLRAFTPFLLRMADNSFSFGVGWDSSFPLAFTRRSRHLRRAFQCFFGFLA
jgi:hypothetical protein